MKKKTNAARILDGMNISYELREYEVDENDLGAENVARKVGIPLHQVFKTLVACGDKTGVIMACVPGSTELHLKMLATVSGNKKVEMIPLKEVQKVTGYIRGGVSPLGAKKQFPVYIEESAVQWSFIAVSAGIRGCQILLSPKDLVNVTKGQFCNIVRSMESQ